MMWTCSIGISLALVSLLAPDYNRYALYELVAGADRVVAGTIVSVQKRTFDLSVEHDLLENVEQEQLRLQRFVDWTCAARWDEYRVGQRVLLFLKGNQAMGAGDEGDWPIVGEQILAPYRIRGFDQVRQTFQGYEQEWTPLSHDALADALAWYRASFRTREATVEGRSVVRYQLSTDAAATDLALHSDLRRHLYEETISSRHFDHAAPIVTATLNSAPIIRARADGYSPPPDASVTWIPRWDSAFGESFISVGDVDGNGWDDLAAKGDADTLWILLLDAAGAVQVRNQITPDELGLANNYFAQSLAPLGDWNGDGVPDLAVGAPAREAQAAGRVLILLLRRDGKLEQARELRASKSVLARGFGNAVAVLRRRERGEFEQLLVDVESSFVDSLTSLEGRHRLSLLRVSRDGDASPLATLESSEVIGSAFDTTFADSMIEIGDLDGDGVSEIAIGVPYDDDGGQYRGAAWIAYFDANGRLRAKSKISDWFGGFEGLLQDEDNFGRALAAPGDLNGDRIPDLLVAAETQAWALFLARDGTVLRSRNYGGIEGDAFVPAQHVTGLAVVEGQAGAKRLAIAGRREPAAESEGRKKPLEAVVWLLRLGPDGALSAR